MIFKDGLIFARENKENNADLLFFFLIIGGEWRRINGFWDRNKKRIDYLKKENSKYSKTRLITFIFLKGSNKKIKKRYLKFLYFLSLSAT